MSDAGKMMAAVWDSLVPEEGVIPRRREGWHGRQRQSGPLTPRNLEVLAASMQLDRKSAAAALGLSDSTVRNHIETVLIKLGVQNRWHAALVLGWLHIPSEFVIVGPGRVPGSRSDETRPSGPGDQSGVA